MSEKNKSWVGQYVRIKHKYIEFESDYGDSSWGSTRLIGTPFNAYFDNGELTSCLYNDDELDSDTRVPHHWVGRVITHIYGVDVDKSVDDTPTNLLVIDGLAVGISRLAFDAKYFEVVKEKRVTVSKWEVDEDFK
jgi:hypothetical protein